MLLCLSLAAAPASAFVTSRTRPTPLLLGARQSSASANIYNNDAWTLKQVSLRNPSALSAVVHPFPNIAVAIDQPLLTDAGNLFPYEQSSRMLGGSALARWLSSVMKGTNVVQLAAVALMGALLLAVLMKSSSSAGNSSSSSASPTGARFPNKLRTLWKITQARVQRYWQERSGTVNTPTPDEPVGEPLTFPSDDNDGFGVCTLASKKTLGRTSFTQYDFKLPQADDVLSLELGQELELCCLDNQDAVANGQFYVYQPQTKPPLGTFSLLLPTASSQKKATQLLGAENANFARVLQQDLKAGDEIAIRPGDCKLDYRGQYLPVTDMVYVCFGTGIVPVLEQVRAVLPTGSSSVTSVTVVWINAQTNDFDVNAELLEKEYFKYSNKMAASCIVENVDQLKSLAESTEINASIPNFRMGSMAVVSGPAILAQKALEYLEDRGFPSDTVCVL
jgi:ferredoxin-NADP reductase